MKPIAPERQYNILQSLKPLLEAIGWFFAFLFAIVFCTFITCVAIWFIWTVLEWLHKDISLVQLLTDQIEWAKTKRIF